ncbi:PREDICTED: protein SGT1 homolog [Habropoda laboriosa]|nr:PREDICTED: protein SGT1 homolog [Habropoda laboriosa]
MANEEAAVKDGNEMPVPKIRYDWYQTDDLVAITIFAKNAINVIVDFQENTLSVSAALPSGNDYSMELDLAHPIVPDECCYKAGSATIQVKLKKKDGITWNSLERSAEVPITPQPIPQVVQCEKDPSQYPSSCKKTRNWDKLEKEIEKQEAKEENEAKGEAALNFLFQRIYVNAPDEVKRAMNKSFQESGGTVLSTNWSEVSKGRVERRPPECLEWKPWNT